MFCNQFLASWKESYSIADQIASPPAKDSMYDPSLCKVVSFYYIIYIATCYNNNVFLSIYIFLHPHPLKIWTEVLKSFKFSMHHLKQWNYLLLLWNMVEFHQDIQLIISVCTYHHYFQILSNGNQMLLLFLLFSNNLFHFQNKI